MTTIPPMPSIWIEAWLDVGESIDDVVHNLDALEAWGTAGWAKVQDLEDNLDDAKDGIRYGEKVCVALVAERDALKAQAAALAGALAFAWDQGIHPMCVETVSKALKTYKGTL